MTHSFLVPAPMVLNIPSSHSDNSGNMTVRRAAAVLASWDWTRLSWRDGSTGLQSAWCKLACGEYELLYRKAADDVFNWRVFYRWYFNPWMLQVTWREALIHEYLALSTVYFSFYTTLFLV